jgi:hypothetical protein
MGKSIGKSMVSGVSGVDFSLESIESPIVSEGVCILQGKNSHHCLALNQHWRSQGLQNPPGCFRRWRANTSDRLAVLGHRLWFGGGSSLVIQYKSDCVMLCLND